MTPTKDQQAQEYAEKKIENEYGISREDFVEAGCRFGYNDVVQAYSDGYTAAEQSMTDSEATVIRGWVARDKFEDTNLGSLFIYPVKPIRKKDGWFALPQDCENNAAMRINSALFPEVTWKNSPIEVELTIKPKKR